MLKSKLVMWAKSRVEKTGGAVPIEIGEARAEEEDERYRRHVIHGGVDAVPAGISRTTASVQSMATVSFPTADCTGISLGIIQEKEKERIGKRTRLR